MNYFEWSPSGSAVFTEPQSSSYLTMLFLPNRLSYMRAHIFMQSRASSRDVPSSMGQKILNLLLLVSS
jgi:hypothetical protein